MYAGLLITVLDVLLIVHAARTGRFMPWGFFILFLPGVGALVYVVFELAPEWFGSYGAQRARRSVAAALDPTGRYRSLRDELDLVDTVANRSAFAEECLKIGRPQGALEHYEAILARPLGDEPAFLIGKARALIKLGRADEAVATLEEVRRRAPNFHSPEGHLLFARALEAADRPDEALDAYARVSHTFPGPSRACAKRGFWNGSGAENRLARSPKRSCVRSGARRATCRRTSGNGSPSPSNWPVRALAPRIRLREKGRSSSPSLTVWIPP